METTTQDLEHEVRRLQYQIDMHHNYYKCVPRNVHEVTVRNVRANYHDFLKMAFILINELKDQNLTVPLELEAFEEQAKALWACDRVRGIDDEA